MTSKERVMTALDFNTPDRVPRAEYFDIFGVGREFADIWREEKGFGPEVSVDDYYNNDVKIAVGDEGLMPTRTEVFEETSEYTITRNSWGEIIQRATGDAFYKPLEVPLKEKSDLETIHVDPPDLDSRYQSLDEQMAKLKQRYCVFAKTGGPFIRSSFVRGDAQLLVDMAGDPQFARELFMFMAKHLAQIGVEQLRRWDLYDTGIWIFDDMASVRGPIFSPKMAEQLLAPAWQYMINTFKQAGAHKVYLHSDGDLMPLLDLFVDIGFEGLNPVEPRTTMDVVEIREKYGQKLGMVGGLDNSVILPRGDRAEIRAHVQHCLSIVKEGGFVIGAHTIGPDISVDTYDYVSELIDEYNRSEMGYAEPAQAQAGLLPSNE